MIYPPVQYYIDLSTLKGDAFLAEVNTIRLAYDHKSSRVVRVGGGYGMDTWQAWKRKAEVIEMAQSYLDGMQEKHDTDAVEWIDSRTPYNVKMFALADTKRSAELLPILWRMSRTLRMLILAVGHLDDIDLVLALYKPVPASRFVQLSYKDR